jgi:pilus assembly protein CpaE
VQLSILLLAIDRVAADSLSKALTQPGHGVVVVASPEDLLAQAAGYSLIVIDKVPPGSEVGAVIGALRADPASQAIPVLAVAQADNLEERIMLLEAGADDLITKPFDQVELEARVEALALRFQRSRGGGAAPPAVTGEARARRIVTVFSPKGGVGSTTVATNLALLAAERHPNGVLVIDLDLSFGQVASHLNLQPRQSVLELVRDDAALHDADVFRTYAVHHAGGIQIMPAPPTPGFASLITAEHVELILARALEAYQIVVIDAGAVLDERMLTVFSRSDVVIVPVLPEIPALNAVHLLLDQLTETGSMGATTMFVLNNLFARELLKRTDIETALGALVSADLPYDPFVYLKAVNEGVPVVRSAPKSAPAEHLRKLAGLVFGVDRPAAVPAAVDGEKKEKRGLFGRRR